MMLNAYTYNTAKSFFDFFNQYATYWSFNYKTMHLISLYFIFKKGHFEIHSPIHVNIVINVSPLKLAFFDLHIYFLGILDPKYSCFTDIGF